MRLYQLATVVGPIIPVRRGVLFRYASKFTHNADKDGSFTALTGLMSILQLLMAYWLLFSACQILLKPVDFFIKT